MFGKNVWPVEMRSVGKLQELPPSDVTTRKFPTYVISFSVNKVIDLQLKWVPYKAQTDTDVTGGSSFLSELKNLNQLFSGVGADFRQFLEKYWSVFDSVKRIFFSETSSTQFMCDEFSANYPFKLS